MRGESGNMTTEPKSSRTAKVLALSLGGSLTMIASIAFAMIASRHLSKHDYATIRQTFLAYEFVAPMLMLGLPNAVYYFLPRAGDDRRGVVIDNITLLLFGGLLFSLFIALGGHALLANRFDNPDLYKTLPWMSVYPLLMMPIAGMAAVLVFAERVRTLAIYSTLSSLLVLVAGIIAVLTTRSYEVPVLVRLVVPAILLPLALVIMFKAVPGTWRLPRMASMHAMLRYSVPLGLATILGTMTVQLHAIIVAALCTTEEFAVYINGAIEIPIIGIVTGSITSVIFAEMSAECAKGNKTAALELFRKASIKSACILFPALFFFLMAAEPFIVFLYSEEYRQSVVPFILYLFVLPIRIVVYGAALMSLGMTRDILFRSVFDLLFNAVICYVLVTLYGYVGAAASLAITLYLWSTPFNLARISQGFAVKWREILPWRDLYRIGVICIFAVPLTLAGMHWQGDVLPLFKLLSAVILYWPVVIYLLYRSEYISLPPSLERFLPDMFRRRSKNHGENCMTK